MSTKQYPSHRQKTDTTGDASLITPLLISTLFDEVEINEITPDSIKKIAQSFVRYSDVLALVHDSNVQLVQFRNVVQCIGTNQDGQQLRKEIDSFGRACIRSCEAAKSCILPQLRHEGVEFTRHASQFIGCVNACVIEMRRCAALERTFPSGEPCITQQQIEHMEEMLETLENLITVHYSTSEASPAERVTPRRRRATNCRPACVCSKLKTSYA